MDPAAMQREWAALIDTGDAVALMSRLADELDASAKGFRVVQASLAAAIEQQVQSTEMQGSRPVYDGHRAIREVH
jgi:hypothetical protein